MASVRLDRISEEIRKAIGDILLYDIKDPRMTTLVSVLRVDVSGDLSYAKVHLSILGDSQIKKDTMDAIKSARGYITRELGRKVKLRKLPRLQFVEDTSIEYSVHMEKMLHDIQADIQNNTEE